MRGAITSRLPMLCLLVLLVSGPARAQYFVRRGWQFARLDEARVAQLMERAPRYGINEIQLSHGIMMYIDAINDSERVRRLVNDVVWRAHAPEAGQWTRVFVWAHELNYTPGQDMAAGAGGAEFCLDPRGRGKAFLEQRKNAYRKALRACPGIDGVVLMFGSSRLEPWQIQCACPWCAGHDPAQKAQLIIEQVRSVVTGEFGKELMVRTFIHSPQQLRWMREALRATPGITVMPKCVPQDWEPYYPHDETIGSVGPKQQVVEFDLVGEYCARGALPFCQPDEIQYRLQYDRDQGAIGAIGRIEGAFGTPNEVNIFAFSRLMQNPDQSVDAIWRDWASERYGRPDEQVISALRRTFDIARKMFYVKGFWVFTKGSEVPTVGRFPAMLRGRSIALYDPAWQAVEADLLSPSEQTLAEIAQEKCEAIWLCDQSLADLEEARTALRPEDYHDLVRVFTLQHRCTEIWRWVADAIFRYQLYKREPSDAQRALVEGALRKIEALAGQVEAEYGSAAYPADPGRMRRLVADIRAEFGRSQTAALYDAPVLRQIEVSSTGPRSAVISWLSDVAANSQVEYGPALPAYGFETAVSGPLAKQHRVKLTGLQPGTRYYFRVISNAADGRRMVSGDFRFRTTPTAQAAPVE